MSDVIISRRGSSGGSGGGKQLVSMYITTNMSYVVPDNILNNELHVRLIGAGGSAYESDEMGGCSGFMNNDTITVVSNEIIPITIGNINKSSWTATGGTTSFGTYLAANGGSYDSGGSGGYCKEEYLISNPSQFGGGCGCNGGIWGGGGGAKMWWKNAKRVGSWVGHGGLYGGGGGATSSSYSNYWNKALSSAGNGGTYGGGGGAATYLAYNTSGGMVGYNDFTGFSFNVNRWVRSGSYGIGGEYGGNGGSGYQNSNLGRFNPVGSNSRRPLFGWYQSQDKYNNGIQIAWAYPNFTASDIKTATNGTNTETWTNVKKCELFNNIYFRGKGLAGNPDRDIVNNTDLYSGGGGGGYGGNGGSGAYLDKILAYRTLDYIEDTNNNYYKSLCDMTLSGGGGGGYGSNGGNGHYDLDDSDHYARLIGGGGGGYGGDGADAVNGGAGGGYGKQSIGRYGGGGYYCPGGGINNTRGGGGIGIWSADGYTLIASYGSGGNNHGGYMSSDGISNYGYPEPGVCIIQYYI